MEATGINRLLSFARELGVEAARPNRANTRATEIPRAPSEPPKGDDGIRVTLSSAAASSANPTIQTARTSEAAPPPVAPELAPARARRAPAGSVFAAYQREAASTSRPNGGERIRIRA